MGLPIETPSTEMMFHQLSTAEIVSFVTERRGESLTLDLELGTV